MSAHIDPWLSCDAEGCGSQYPEEAEYSEFTDATLRELRTAAKADGWRCHRDKDFCEDHATSPAALAAQRGSHKRPRITPTWRM